MGMFDRVWFTCPTCRTKLEVQTKAGSRNLHDYDSDRVPLTIAAAIRGTTVLCDICGDRWVVDVHAPMVVSAFLHPYEPSPYIEEER